MMKAILQTSPIFDLDEKNSPDVTSGLFFFGCALRPRTISLRDKYGANISIFP